LYVFALCAIFDVNNHLHSFIQLVWRLILLILF